jgi:hypothetical protein
MSTRQMRLTSHDEILKRLQELSGKKINIVLVDNTVVFGTVGHANSEEIELENMRLAKIKILMKMVREIYYDTKE